MIIWSRSLSQREQATYSRESTPRTEMTRHDLERLLDEVRAGRTPVGDALERVHRSLREAPFEDMGFARLDTHRAVRQGFPEVVLGTGKTPAQIAAIAERIVARGQTLLVTRATPEAQAAVRRQSARGGLQRDRANRQPATAGHRARHGDRAGGVRGHVGSPRRRGGRGHSGPDGQRGRSAVRRRRRRHPPAAARAARGWTPRA